MPFLPFYPGMIFDLDGTLLDSMEVWNQVDQEFLAQFGYSVPSDLMEKIKVMNLPECAAYFRRRFSLPLSSREIMFCLDTVSIRLSSHSFPTIHNFS